MNTVSTTPNNLLDTPPKIIRLSSALACSSPCYSVMAESISGNATALHVQLAGRNQTCSEEHLAKIAMLIADWRAVSPFLGLTEAEEIAILGASLHSVPAQKIAMLRKWKLKRGAKATYKRLCRIFRDCGLRDLEEKVTKLVVAESSSSSDEEGERQTLCKWVGLVNTSVYGSLSVTTGVEGPTKQHVRGEQGIGIPILIDCYLC